MTRSFGELEKKVGRQRYSTVLLSPSHRKNVCMLGVVFRVTMDFTLAG
jgi:hypothetical protein